MRFELFKLIVQPVVIKRENGVVVGEQVGEAVSLYTLEQVAELHAKMLAALETENAQQAQLEAAGAAKEPEDDAAG